MTPPPSSNNNNDHTMRRKDSTSDRERTRDGARGDARQTTTGNSNSGTTGVRTAVDEDDRIGPYLIGEEIGRGSFATVFKGARHVSSHKFISHLDRRARLFLLFASFTEQNQIIGYECFSRRQVRREK